MMAWIRGVSERLRALFQKGAEEAELEEELRFHLNKEIEKNLRDGMSHGDARRAAYLRFGGVERMKEQVRDARGVRPLEDFFTDVRYAVRTLSKSPGFTAIALVSLALGLGANTAVFSWVNAVAMRDVPLHAPERLVNLYRDRMSERSDPLNYPDYMEILEGTADVFESVGGFQFTFTQRDESEDVQTLIVEMVTGNYFPLLGVGAHLGRMILPEDHVAAGSHAVVVLGHGFWGREFGGDASVLGTSMRLGGHVYTVVGVAPDEYPGSLRGIEPDLYAPIMMARQLLPMGGDPVESRGYNSFNGVARLLPGATVAEAAGAMRRMTNSLRERFPETWQAGDSLVVAAKSDVIFNPAADAVLVPANFVAVGIVGLVLLIACANLASFLLARASDRQGETAVRLAMGATRGRLARQFMTETLLLALLGSVGGVLLAEWLVRLAMGMTLPFPIPFSVDLSVDGAVLAFTAVVAVVTGVAVGLVPAVQATRPDLMPTLKDGSGGSAQRRSVRMGHVLVGGQIAVSLVLLVASGLLVRSFQASRHMDMGFGNEPAALVSFLQPVDRFSNAEGRENVVTLLGRMRALPEVTHAGVVGNLHLNPVNTMFLDVNVDGVAPPPGRSAHPVDFTRVDGGFFAAATVELLEGRVFDERDGLDGLPVTIINDVLADRFWPGESPLGREVRIEVPGFPPVTVVGVTRGTKVRSPGESPRPFLYLSYGQDYTAWVTVVARTRGAAEATTGELFRLVKEEVPGAIVSDLKTMDQHLAVMLIARRISAVLSGGFAVVALLLAVIGLYGVVSYAVARRAPEMGIRMSLGAAPRSVVGLLVAGGMRVVLLGTVAGLALAFTGSRLLAGLLYGVEPFDPATVVGVTVLLLGVALVAAFVPARRASRVDPLKALRST
jgi:predicted permease